MSMDDIAGVLAHEVAHLVARHVIERRTTKLFATEIAKWFGFTGALGNDLVQSRMHELEAYHMGLLIMAQVYLLSSFLSWKTKLLHKPY